ncbi:MAG TPA: cupin domain-containing protein [Agitococcus sp.]|nr:cupin domain-containing protein [Agitococcus sp.]
MSSIFIAGQGESLATPTIDYPRAERLVNGNPQRLTQNLYEHPNMSCGIWQCEVGAWRIEFASNKQEFFNIIKGEVRLHDIQGNFVEIQAGQAGVIPPNFKGIFEVVEVVQKYYVIVEV